ncbi:MAG: ATP-binding protein [Candidatus Wallbacteria bacterium]|nr:ATP-binding protein [Candidatus Wallbacteria bacterium]
MEKPLLAAARQFPSVIVTGPRQSGKTTLLKHLFSGKYRYVSLDNPDIRLLAAKEPALFFESFPPPLIIDEIQYVPQLFQQIKIMIDNQREMRGRFIFTGSQIFPLMAHVGESLAGRIAVFTLLPFSLREQGCEVESMDLQLLQKKILKGGFPDVALRKDLNLETWFTGYLQTYLERDVRQLRQIGDLGDFQRFLQLTAAQNGQVLHLSNLSRDLGVAVNTVKAWVTILEASGQIILVKPFYRNKGKRIIKSPKLYFLDTGLLCHLNGITSEKQIFKGPLSGQVLETVVLEEIVKNFHNTGKIPRVYWWRTSHGDEVDFIVEDRGRIIPVEVKLSSSVNSGMAKGLNQFCELFQDEVERAFLVSLSRESLKLGLRTVSLHFSDFVFKTISK